LTIEAVSCATSYPAWRAAAPVSPSGNGLYVTTINGVLVDAPCTLEIGCAQ
jgi:hypothetical protein